MKLELKDIACYLPYRLRVQYINCSTKRKLVAVINGVSTDNIETTYNRAINGCKGDIISWSGHNNVSDMSVKPILRPLSDLTKEIEVNGVNVIHIIELFKLLDPCDYVDYNGKFNNKRLQIDDDWNHGLTYFHEDGDVNFSFDSSTNSFYLMVHTDPQLISNQLDMFNKLFEWHFDVFGLIEKGLAIDINSLKNK